MAYAEKSYKYYLLTNWNQENKCGFLQYFFSNLPYIFIGNHVATFPEFVVTLLKRHHADFSNFAIITLLYNYIIELNMENDI